MCIRDSGYTAATILTRPHRSAFYKRPKSTTHSRRIPQKTNSFCARISGGNQLIHCACTYYKLRPISDAWTGPRTRFVSQLITEHWTAYDKHPLCIVTLHSLMVASIVIVMLLILLHVMASSIGECYLQLVRILCSAADVLVCNYLPLLIQISLLSGHIIFLSLAYLLAELCTCF